MDALVFNGKSTKFPKASYGNCLLIWSQTMSPAIETDLDRPEDVGSVKYSVQDNQSVIYFIIRLQDNLINNNLSTYSYYWKR